MLKGDTGCSAVCSSRDYCQDDWYHNHCWGQTRREARRARIHISALCETIRFAEGCGGSQYNLFSLFWWSFDHHCSKEGKLTDLIVGWELLVTSQSTSQSSVVIISTAVGVWRGMHLLGDDNLGVCPGCPLKK